MVLAALWALGAFTCWVFADSFNKLSGDTLSLFQRGLVNQGVATLVFLAAAFHGRGIRELETKKPLFHLLRGGINVLNVFTLYYAVTILPLANFYAIAFTSPFMIALISFFFLKESVSIGVWAAILAGFFGVLVAINPEHYDPAAWNLWGVAAMVLANLCYAFYALSIKTGGGKESPVALNFYTELVTVVAFLLIVAMRGDWGYSLRGLAYIGCSGFFNGFAGLLITAAYRRAKNAFVASFHYSQIVAGGLFGYFIWGDVPTPHLIAGASIIIAAGLYVLWHGARTREDAVVPAAAILP